MASKAIVIGRAGKLGSFVLDIGYEKAVIIAEILNRGEERRDYRSSSYKGTPIEGMPMRKFQIELSRYGCFVEESGHLRMGKGFSLEVESESYII